MPRELKVCPKCGRTLRVLNQEHVCGLYDIGPHFERKDPIGKTSFDWILEIFEELGPIDVLPMKTMIAFANGVNVAFLRTKRSGAEVSFVLPRPLGSPRIIGETPYSKSKTIYRTVVTDEADLDSELGSWLTEAYLGS